MKPALGAILASPSIRRRKEEARIYMRLSMTNYAVSKGYITAQEASRRMYALAVELETLGPRLARQVEAA